jgi:uncharacterized protein YkwD
MKAKFLKAILPLALVFTMVSCSNDSTDDLTSSGQLVVNYEYNAAELRLITLINDYRESQGLNTLQVINHISYKSEEHNVYMIDKKVVNHDYFESRSKNIISVLGAERVGENIAYNYVNPESALHAWLNSPSHKANVVGNYTHFGISISIDPVSGRKYYTNIFMKKK